MLAFWVLWVGEIFGRLSLDAHRVWAFCFLRGCGARDWVLCGWGMRVVVLSYISLLSLSGGGRM